MEAISRMALTPRRGNLWSAVLILPFLTGSDYLDLSGRSSALLFLVSLLSVIFAAGGEFVLLMQEEAGNGKELDTDSLRGKSCQMLLSTRRPAALITHALLLLVAFLGLVFSPSTATLLIMLLSIGVSGYGMVEEARFAAFKAA
ncbi:hypothetical protein KRX56_08555 [Dermabacteraceae bacterium TAE3-ERU27]|nr:hypothetical protein [Dermabacteraceae bacterium TAE3-ERU27]